LSKVLQNSVSTKSINVDSYHFKSRQKNPEWSTEKLVPLRACLIRNNAEFEVYISRTPKWLTRFEKESVNIDSGEVVYSDYLSDDFKASRNRKIKTVEKFCNFYEPLYQAREVSLLFHTFTRMNYSKQDMRRMLDNVKIRYGALKREIRGYIWVLEIPETNHVHYHLIVAIDRYEVKEIPEQLKFDDLWGQLTNVEFIKKGIRVYLSKYLYKSNAKLLHKRSYAISRKLL